MHDLLVHTEEKTTVLQVDWVLVLITGLSKSSDLRILLQKTFKYRSYLTSNL